MVFGSAAVIKMPWSMSFDFQQLVLWEKLSPGLWGTRVYAWGFVRARRDIATEWRVEGDA